MKDLITKLESKIKDCNNTNTIFDTRKYVLLDDVKELLAAINYTHCCTELKDKTGYNNIDDIDPSWIEYVKQLSIPLVGNHVFCPHCGDKRQLKVETDLNSGRVCKSRLCKGK